MSSGDTVSVERTHLMPTKFLVVWLSTNPTDALGDVPGLDEGCGRRGGTLSPDPLPAALSRTHPILTPDFSSVSGPGFLQAVQSLTGDALPR